MHVTPFSYLANYIPVRKELKIRVEGNIGVVSNERDYRLNYLNETALMIFFLIDGKRNIGDIAALFMKDVDVERSVFEQDLIEILRNFQWQRIITLKRNS